MIKMIHRVTGCEMWVHESNVESFKSRGHAVASAPKKEPVKRKPVRKTTKK